MNLLNHVCFLHLMNMLVLHAALSMCVINWIKCMEGWMTCYYKSPTKRKKGKKKDQKKEKEKEVI